VRGHLLAWRATGDDAEFDRAEAGARQLARQARWSTDGTVAWPLPAGLEGPHERTYLGYAHGTAGIADVLVDLVELTGADHHLPLVRAAVTTVAQAARVVGDDDRPAWADRKDGALMLPLWCHGGGGIARFLRRAGRLLGDGPAVELAARARRAAAATLVAGPSQCHGLAGTVELLLDAPEDPDAATGAEHVGAVLAAFVTPADGLDPPSPLALRDDDLMTGRAGVLRALSRLAAPATVGPLLDPTATAVAVPAGAQR
jgi:lantibiotic modifying enzyme